MAEFSVIFTPTIKYKKTVSHVNKLVTFILTCTVRKPDTETERKANLKNSEGLRRLARWHVIKSRLVTISSHSRE